MSGISSDQERQIKELIAQGNKIAAIKFYRERTGLSLKDAKDAVEAIEMGTLIDFSTPQQVNEPDPYLENQIKRLLVERKKIEAVKVYRETYNCGLKEAKDAVDIIELQMRMDSRSSLPPTPTINNDPFAEDTQRNRGCLILAILLVTIGGLAFFFLIGSGY